MLSRVAERLYWMSRYLERTEDTARIVSAYNHLIMDLPKGAEPGWDIMVQILDAEPYFHQRFRSVNEQNVLKLLIGDDGASCSLRHSWHVLQHGGGAAARGAAAGRDAGRDAHETGSTRRDGCQTGRAQRSSAGCRTRPPSSRCPRPSRGSWSTAGACAGGWSSGWGRHGLADVGGREGLVQVENQNEGVPTWLM